ncbi:MAG: hypothetical protein LBB90_09225, partial [Tannerella sp.]|nr:hypothetical protein [Tannerella sp.]
LTVCRFDFSAKISVPGGGYKTVLIELQKAKLASDIMRFRRYLGLHYQNPNNTYGNGKARQIYCIFLLGYDICIPEYPVIRVDYNGRDGTTGEALEVENEFIRSLHHRSWIIQIDQLKKRRRSDVEKLLSIFDQENRTQNHHILNVNEEEFPEIYRPVIRRLRMAYESEDIQVEMEMEDDFLKEIQDRERLIAEQDKALEESRKVIEDRDKTIKESKKVIEDRGKALEESKKIIEDKEKALEEKEKALEESRKLIEALKRQLPESQKPK